MVKYKEVKEEELEEPASPFLVKLVSKSFWILAAIFSARNLFNYSMHRPALWFYAKLCYFLIFLLSVGSSLYLRLWLGGVPYQRWRLYIPIPIYTITGLYIVGYFLMILTFGISFASIFYMSIFNMGLLSFLSFF